MTIRVSQDGTILRLTLDRAEKKNALTNDMYGALTAQLDRAEQDDSIRVILIDAEGDVFCAGNDLNDFAAIASGQLRRDQIKSFEFLHALARATCPLVTAVQGPAVGIGVTLLLHSDIAVVADDAKLSVPFIDLGLVPEAASSVLMPMRIGHARAFEMFALGKTREVYGIRNLTLNRQEQTIRVEYDATRLTSATVASLLRGSGLMLTEEVSLIPPQPVAEAAVAPVAPTPAK